MKKKIKKKDNTLAIAIIIVAVITLLMVCGILGLSKLQNSRTYTYEEMLHDHDGDGVPDH